MTNTFHKIMHSHMVLRVIAARPRLFISMASGLVLALLLPPDLAKHPVTRMIIGWNAGACLYIGLALRMMFSSPASTMRHRARIQDEGRATILLLVIIASVTSLAATIAELSVVKDVHGSLRTLHIALTALTIVSAWCFTHIMFALHYAHDFYRDIDRGGDGGLQFPGTNTPGYPDFLYFAAVIGTSGQTADISFASTALRRLGTLHCILAFFFNTTILALTINIASGLF